MATIDEKRIPSTALSFDETSEVKVTKDGDKRKASMIGYSGGIIKNHWYWGNVAFDISGMSFPKKKYPILRDHNTDRVVGHSPKPKTDGFKLTFDDVTLVSTKDAEDFSQLSDDGVPFEASIYLQPSSIERVERDEFADVNGYKFEGPGYIFRKSKFKECSVCLFGADSDTSALAMAETDKFLDLSKIITHREQKPSEEKVMSIEKFQESDPDGYKKLVGDITKQVSEQFSQQITEKDSVIAEKDSMIADLEKKVTSFTDDNKSLADKVKDLDKKFSMQTEAMISAKADSVLEKIIGDSELPDRAKEKIKKFSDYTQFVKDDKLDIEGFSKSIHDEITEWKTMFGDMKSGSVQGGAGTRGRDLGDADKQFTEKDADELATQMLKGARILSEENK